MALFGKKREREQRGENHRGARKDRVHTRAHVKKGDYLGDLVDHVRKTGSETYHHRAPIEPRGTALAPVDQQRRNGETSNKISIEILCPRIVITVQVVLKKRRRRPDNDRGEDRGIAFREVCTTR